MKVALAHKLRPIEATIAILVTILAVVSLLLYMKHYYLPAALALLSPVIVVLLTSPRLSFYILLFCLFIWKYILTSPSIMLIDMVALILIGAFFIDLLLKGKTTIALPAIYKYYVALFLTLLFCAVFAVNMAVAVTPLIRVIVQLFVIVVIYNIVSCDEITKYLRFFLIIALAHSLYNIFIFFKYGGIYRVFGTAGNYFDDLAMLAIPVSFAFLVWTESTKTALKYGVVFVVLIFGLIATHSRGPMLTVIWVTITMTVFSYIKSRRMNIRRVQKRLKWLLLGTAATAGFLLLFSDIYATVGARFPELLEPSHGTVWLRLSLWHASLLTFLKYPLTGIGPGGFRYIESTIPLLRFGLAMIYIPYLSAHNLFLHYLAEGGIIGATALVALFFKHFRNSIFSLGKRFSKTAPVVAMSLFGTGLTIFFTIFYMDGWMWGTNAYAAPIFIALTAKLVSYSSYED